MHVAQELPQVFDLGSKFGIGRWALTLAEFGTYRGTDSCLVPTILKRLVEDDLSPLVVQRQKLFGGGNAQTVVQHDRSQKRIIKNPNPLGNVRLGAIDRFGNLTRTPSAGPHQFAQRICFFARAEVIALEVLDQRQEIRPIGTVLSNDCWHLGPLDGAECGKPPVTGYELVLLAFSTYDHRLKQAVFAD
jgi:hypothetical protein